MRLRAFVGAALLRPGPILTGALALAGLLVFALGGLPGLGLPGLGPVPRAGAQAGAGEGEPTPQTDASLPARNVTMIGATPLEAGASGAEETWGVGAPADARGAGSALLVRYTSAGGWSLGPPLLDAKEHPLSGFRIAHGPLAGQMTPTGAGVLVGTAPKEGHTVPVVLVRDPGGPFREPSEAPPLKEGEEPLGARAPLIAALDEGGGHAGALLVPVREAGGGEDAVLHWDGAQWRREAIEVPAGEGFRVLALAASSPANAWLLAQLSAKTHATGAVALFRRLPSGAPAGWSWQPVALAPGKADGEVHPLTVPVVPAEPGGPTAEPFAVPGAGAPPTVEAQLLTVTSQGVWVDGQRPDVHTVRPASTTLFVEPEGETAVGRVAASWCLVPAGAPAGTPSCDHPLPEALPAGPSRSMAWPSSSAAAPYGERVVTGLSEGVSLRLDGESFTRVLALGANAGAAPGSTLGAAFSSAREGWLGAQGLPVHLTLAPAPSRLTQWPVPFRHALTAIAPQPGATAGALTSEALAVGDQGEVARFKPGEGWVPESLFGAGERVETPRLRAVAWPTPTRAYAVGDLGQMWLWRGETGLWERDPATPPNFRGNLLGVAFAPGDSTRGYAVGSTAVGVGGVLLRYGKTWTPQTALPPQAAGASFTSVAFAGSEALVAYRRLVNPERDEYVGGLLIENGSGWQVDEGAAALMGANAPLAVAGLPDGGAAFSTVGPEGTRVFERESAAAPWQPTATPLTGATAGSLALFREGGALRAIVSSGGATENYEQEREPAPPPGFPPNLIGPYPIGLAGPASGILRQTAAGWSDESHELNPVGEPEGSFIFYDLPYRLEPVLAVLPEPNGAQGWAVGGEIFKEARLDTSAVQRYAAAGQAAAAPPGAGAAPVALHAGEATFAIGGGAQCAATCADREMARIGPDVWLSTALARARQIGVRAFLYTGPRLTKDEATGLTKPPIPFEREFARYAALMAAGLPAYVAASPQDLDARPEALGSEALFEQAFAGFPEPLGRGQAAAGLATAPEGRPFGGAEAELQRCWQEVGCEGAYYAFDSSGAAGTVRVVVLDDTRDVSGAQLQWLARQLQSAKESHEPAIAVGNADLNAQILAGDHEAVEVARVLVGGASAYFYDSPEENVQKPLRAGGDEIPSFGSGTLGYVNVYRELNGEFNGASGFLLGEVDLARYEAEKSYLAGNRAAVTARLIPNIGELALEARDGVLLRRSKPALFDALARRPRAGSRARGQEVPGPEVDPYIPIPSNCIGAGCATTALLPAYTFSSSRPDVGGFVKPNLTSPDPHAVLANAKGEPIREPVNPETGVEESTSGLFCAYNPGTTIVTITAGGLSSSLPVTVQAGSVREPCGTVPLKELPARTQTAPPPPAPAPAPAGAAPAAAPPLVPLPPPPAPPLPAALSSPPPPPSFLAVPAPLLPPLAVVPPPPPPAANPTPPSGTAPVQAVEREEEEEEATESVGNQALAYSAPEHEPSPAYVLGIVLLAAFAGASVCGRPRRGRREVRVAPATLSTLRTQRRLSADRRRP